MSLYEEGKLLYETKPDDLMAMLFGIPEKQNQAEFAQGYMDAAFDEWLNGCGSLIRDIPVGARQKCMEEIDAVIARHLPI